MLATVPIDLLAAVVILEGAAGPRAGGPGPRGALMLAVGEPVVQLAAGDDVVVAVTDLGDVLLLDGHGVVRRRLGGEAADAPGGPLARARRRGNAGGTGTAGRDGFSIGAGIPADDDFNDPYDVDSDVEDPTNVLLDDGPSRRRTARAVSEDGGRVVAAGGRTAWFVRADGLVRASVDSSAPPERVGGSPVARWSALAASADGNWLAGVRGGWLVRSRDGGETFDPIAPVAGSGSRLALTNEGDILLVDGDGAHRIGAAADHGAGAWPAALDACASARGTVVLTAGGVAIVDPAEPSHVGGQPDAASATRERIALPEDADRLACDAGGEILAVGGASLWISSDAGRRWSRLSELPPVAATALAVAGGAVWVATRNGLWRVAGPRAVESSWGSWKDAPSSGPSADALPSEEAGTGAAAMRPPRPDAAFLDLSLEGRRPSWWAGALPRVDLGFAWATATGRRDVRAFVLLSFAIDRDTARALVHRRLIDQARIRRGELARATLALGATNPAGSDPIEAEERAALARVLEAAHE